MTQPHRIPTGWQVRFYVKLAESRRIKSEQPLDEYTAIKGAFSGQMAPTAFRPRLDGIRHVFAQKARPGVREKLRHRLFRLSRRKKSPKCVECAPVPRYALRIALRAQHPAARPDVRGEERRRRSVRAGIHERRTLQPS